MYRRVILLLAVGSLLGAATAAQPHAIAPVADGVGLDPIGVVERYGQPDFAVSNLLVYRRSFAELVADVSFSVFDGVVSEVSFAFPAGDRDAERLRKDGDRVLKRLRVLYGPPSGSVRSSDTYKSHLWLDEHGEMLHTVVYTPGREEHSLRVARRESQEAHR